MYNDYYPIKNIKFKENMTPVFIESNVLTE